MLREDEVGDGDVEDDAVRNFDEDDGKDNDAEEEEEEDDDVEDNDAGRGLLFNIITRARVCASPLSRNAHGCMPDHLLRITGKMAADQKLAARFVRACAVEMHMDMSTKGAIYARIYR